MLILLLVNEPPDLGQEETTYRVFALLTGGLLSLTPVTGIALVLSRSQRRWFIAAVLVLGLPTLAVAAGAATAAVRLWG